MEIGEKIRFYKDKYRLQFEDIAYFLSMKCGYVSTQSIKMWLKGYPKPKSDKRERLEEMFEILDAKQPKQRWIAFYELGFGEDYEG